MGEGGNEATGLVRGDAASTATVGGGMTKFAVQATFNGYVRRVGDSELAADILAATVSRVKGTGTNSDGTPLTDAADENDAQALTRVRVKLGLETFTFQDPDDPDDPFNTAFASPSTTVRYEAVTSDASVLPMVRDLVTTAAGRDADDTATPAVTEIAPVAVGFAVDNADTDAKEDENAASQVRIGRSSSVEAPK